MATDKKSQHVGNHGGRYVDMEGMTKQFTYIDHDKKTKISSSKLSKEELVETKNSIKSYLKNKIEEILALPAVNAVRNEIGIYEKFVIRDTEKKAIVWDKTSLTDACMINSDLARNIFNEVWKRTVKEQYWYEDMTHEEIVSGQWKKWS